MTKNTVLTEDSAQESLAVKAKLHTSYSVMILSIALGTTAYLDKIHHENRADRLEKTLEIIKSEPKMLKSSAKPSKSLSGFYT